MDTFVILSECSCSYWVKIFPIKRLVPRCGRSFSTSVQDLIQEQRVLELRMTKIHQSLLIVLWWRVTTIAIMDVDYGNNSTVTEIMVVDYNYSDRINLKSGNDGWLHLTIVDYGDSGWSLGLWPIKVMMTSNSDDVITIYVLVLVSMPSVIMMIMVKMVWC